MDNTMVKAVANPHMDVLGHCTGRIVVGRGRPESAFDSEIVFAASFFDQYAASHGPVAPDGSALAVAGRLVDDAETKDPRVYVVPTRATETAVAVGAGVYPVWAA